VRKQWVVIIFLVLACLFLLVVGVYNLPPIHDRLSWRVANWAADIKRFMNPPEKIIFQPGGQNTPGAIETIVKNTLDVLLPTPGRTQSVDISPTPETKDLQATGTILISAPPFPSETPPLSSTPVPGQALLTGIVHEWQKFNNCGPANLAMALSYWGWQGDQSDTQSYLRPNLEIDDKNVMPSEMVTFVEKFTDLHALTRVGGDLELLKRLIAAGFPALIEEGHDPVDDFWMGHYLVINGYDDATGRLTTQDSLLGPDLSRKYEELTDHWWRDFNYVYIVIYPPEREAEVLSILGSQVDETSNYQSAAQRAMRETNLLAGRDQFFAWFNLGSSQVGLQDTISAAQAYDTAFSLYAKLPEEERPYRLMWYQMGPYQAYYHTGRYQDVIDLANTTLAWATQPVLEETYYWRGMAYEALGDLNRAIKDFQKAAAINPNFVLPLQELERLGVAIP
jgi:tetratricopeptide (TPR) repeat protein